MSAAGPEVAAHSPTPPGVVLIGCGDMGRLYARALSEAGALAGVVVRTRRSAKALASELTVPVGTSLDAMLEQTAARALAVLSPTEAHALHVAAALSRRLPALVIKPAAGRPETARALAAHAERLGVPVMVAHEGVFAPPFLALERELRTGRLGAVRRIEWLKEGREDYSGGRSAPAPGAADRAGENLGYLHATAMHELYVANRLAGRRAPSEAFVDVVRAAVQDPLLDARLRYPDGVEVHVRYGGRDAGAFRRGLHVRCERGALLWKVEPGRTTLKVRDADGTRDLRTGDHRGDNPAAPVVAAFLDVVRRGPDAVTEDLHDGARALEAASCLTAAAARHLGLPPDPFTAEPELPWSVG